MLFADQKGVALLAVIFFLVVIAFTGIVFVSMSSNSMTQSVNEIRADQALFIAEGGMERARGYLAGKDPTCPAGGCTCSSITGNTLFTNKSLGQGEFTVTGISLGGQCVLTSTGGVPTISSGTVQRVITYTAITTIQDAWAVGYNVSSAGNRPFMAHWDGTAWSNLTAAAPNIGGANLMEVSMVSSSYGWAVSNQGHFINYNGPVWTLFPGFNSSATLYSIYMNSNTDGWAVGSGGEIDRWNGTTWAKYASSPTTRTLQGIYCFNASFCWAVGSRSGGGNGQSTIIFWDGTSWSAPFTNGLNGVTLRFVSCVDTANCWAIGSSGGEIIYWNGTKWALQDNANPQSLFGVDCLDLTHCWAVGNSGEIMKWNGVVWSLDPKSGIVTTRNLTFVSCVILADCWAVGSNGTLLHYDGNNWTNYTPGGGWPTSQLNSLSQFRGGNAATSWKEVIQ